jgi:hypothetical protein
VSETISTDRVFLRTFNGEQFDTFDNVEDEVLGKILMDTLAMARLARSEKFFMMKQFPLDIDALGSIMALVFN